MLTRRQLSLVHSRATLVAQARARERGVDVDVGVDVGVGVGVGVDVGSPRPTLMAVICSSSARSFTVPTEIERDGEVGA